MRRLALVLAAIVALIGATMVPAQAQMYINKCRVLVSDEANYNQVCFAATYHAMAGVPGLSVDRIQTSFNDNGDWSSPVAVDCYNLRIYNASGDIRWQKTGDACDIYTSAGNHEYAPGEDMPQSVTASIRWNANANIRLAPDMDFTMTLYLTQ